MLLGWITEDDRQRDPPLTQLGLQARIHSEKAAKRRFPVLAAQQQGCPHHPHPTPRPPHTVRPHRPHRASTPLRWSKGTALNRALPAVGVAGAGTPATRVLPTSGHKSPGCTHSSGVGEAPCAAFPSKGATISTEAGSPACGSAALRAFLLERVSLTPEIQQLRAEHRGRQGPSAFSHDRSS